MHLSAAHAAGHRWPSVRGPSGRSDETVAGVAKLVHAPHSTARDDSHAPPGHSPEAELLPEQDLPRRPRPLFRGSHEHRLGHYVDVTV